MQLSGAPAKIVEPFAVNAAPSGGYGGKRTVPVPSQIGITPGAASFNDGFPPTTMTPITGGGVVMSGLDMNGALNQISAPVVWNNAGASFLYDSAFSSAVGGYPKGARLIAASGLGFWISTVDNNITNPDTGGAGWVLQSAGIAQVASVYASAQQTLVSGVSKVLWDTVEFDSFGLWNGTNKNFQAPWAGKYRFSGSIYLPAPAGQLAGTQIFKNGSLARLCNEYPQVSDGDMAYSFSAIIACAISDTLDARMLVGASTLAGTASGSSQAYVYGQIEYLGA